MNNVDTSLEHFLSVVEDIEEPCEHSEHEALKNIHDSGAGKWYLTSKDCPSCGASGRTGLVCDRYASCVMRGMVEVFHHCGYIFGVGMEGYTEIKRKG